MKKQLILPLGILACGYAHADESKTDLFLLLGGQSSSTPVQTSMHDAGAAAASYTLGTGGSGVQTTQGYSSGESSGGNSAAYAEDKYEGGSTSQASSTPTRSSRSSSSRRSSSRRVSSSAGVSAQSGGYVSPSYGGSKDGKGVIPVAAPQSPMTFYVEGGYQSDYTYHGLSQIGNAAIGVNDAVGMYFVGVGAQYKGFNLSLKYVHSEGSELTPRFNTAKSENYEEYVFDINYTLGVIAGPQGEGNWLDFTLGYQLLSFEEETFWNTDAQHVFYAQVKMNRYQWVRPSLTYYKFTQADALNSGTNAPGAEILEGDQIIFQIDGGGNVYENGNMTVGVGYYVQVGFDDEYNTAASWNQNWYQAGISVPVSFGNFSVIPSINYTDSDIPSGAKDLSPDFWWGLKAKYTF